MSCSTVYRWAKEGHLIPPFNWSKYTVWDEAELYKWIENRKNTKVSLIKKILENKCLKISIKIN